MAYPTLKNLKWNYIVTDKENIGLAKKFNRFFFVFFFYLTQLHGKTQTKFLVNPIQITSTI